MFHGYCTFSSFLPQFSGTGHKLTSGETAATTPFGASTGGGWLGGAFSGTTTASSSSSSSSAATSTSATDRETMAARRLAALAGRGEQQEHLLGATEGASTSPADLQKLQVSRGYGSVASATALTGNAVADRGAIAARRIVALQGSSSQSSSQSSSGSGDGGAS